MKKINEACCSSPRLDLFLVRGVVVGLGSSLHVRDLLGSTSAVLSEHNIAGGSCRLYCQLDKESNSSLRHYRATPSHCWDIVFAFRCTDRLHRASRSLVIRPPRHWDRVSSGMEVREAFIVKAFGTRIIKPISIGHQSSSERLLLQHRQVTRYRCGSLFLRLATEWAVRDSYPLSVQLPDCPSASMQTPPAAFAN